MNFIFFTIIVIVIVRSIAAYRSYDQRFYTRKCPPPQVEQSDLIIDGLNTDISPSQMHNILQKRNFYYSQLEPRLQEIFLKRVKAFMNDKVFIIKDEKGFREMPVLISASAVQLCFGLSDFRLPFYKYIRIFPQEYFSEHVFFRVLQGNVENNVISVAWNHFLKGYEENTDGANVGLHEMSHALYMQKMVIESDPTKKFKKRFSQVKFECKEAVNLEMAGHKNLYSAYGRANFQEFWAESVELFFEKTDDLYNQHPCVFDALCILLNQDPRNAASPVLKNNLSLEEKLGLMFTWNKLVPGENM